MALAHRLIGFALTQAIGVGGRAVSDQLDVWLDDPAERLPKALSSANDDAWRVLELALQGQGEIGDRLAALPARLFNTAEKRGLADAVGAFLDQHPLSLPDRAAASAALVELRDARARGLLALGGRDGLGIGTSGLAAHGDPFALLGAAQGAVAALADDLAGDGCTCLAEVLRAQPPHQPPLLAVAFGWFLRRRVEQDAELARGLSFTQLDRQVHGNVWEWCSAYLDDYQKAPRDGSDWSRSAGNLRVRGGSWLDMPGWLRSAHRYKYVEGWNLDPVGARLAQDLFL